MEFVANGRQPVVSPAAEAWFPHNHHGARCVSDNALCNAAKKRMGQAGASVCPHDDQIKSLGRRIACDAVCRPAGKDRR